MSQIFSGNANALGGAVVTAAPGTDLTPLLSTYANTGTTIYLAANTFANPYLIRSLNVPAGASAGGLTIKGAVAPTRRTFAGVRGAATQLTNTQLAGSASVVSVLGDYKTNDFSAGVTGTGWDGLVLEDLVLYGGNSSPSGGRGLFFDSSATIRFNRVKTLDFQGGITKSCYHLITDQHTVCMSSNMSFANIGGHIHDPAFFTGRDSIYDSLPGAHYYVGTGGSPSDLTGEAQRWEEVGTTQCNPSGMYTMDVAYDLEHTVAHPLREFRFQRLEATNVKPMYTTNIGSVTGSELILRITRNYATTIGALSVAGVPAGGVPVNGTAAAGNVASVGQFTLDYLEVTWEAGGPVVGGVSPRAFNYIQANWVGRHNINRARIILNGPTLANQGSGNQPAIIMLRDASTAGVANVLGEDFTIGLLEIGYNLQTDSTGRFIPAGQTLPVFSLDRLNTGTTTFGFFRVGKTVLLGPTGPTPNSIAVGTTPFTFTVPAGGEGTYQVLATGATFSSNTQINGVTTGQNTGAWHLQPTETITIAYSAGLPTLNQYLGPNEPATPGDGVNALWSTLYRFGDSAGANVTTLAIEDLGAVDYTQLAAAAINSPIRTLGPGHTSTKRTVLSLAPNDASDTITYPGSGVAYTHGTTNLVTKNRPADGPGMVVIIGGTLSNVTLNGRSLATAAVAGGIPVWVEIGDAVVTTSTVSPTMGYVGSRRSGA